MSLLQKLNPSIISSHTVVIGSELVLLYSKELCSYSSLSLSLSLLPLQVVSEGCSEDVQCHVLSLLREVTFHSIMATMEFEQIGGMKLIQQVLQKPQAAVGEKILDVSTTL